MRNTHDSAWVHSARKVTEQYQIGFLARRPEAGLQPGSPAVGRSNRLTPAELGPASTRSASTEPNNRHFLQRRSVTDGFCRSELARDSGLRSPASRLLQVERAHRAPLQFPVSVRCFGCVALRYAETGMSSPALSRNAVVAPVPRTKPWRLKGCRAASPYRAPPGATV